MQTINSWHVLVVAGQSNAQGFGEALPLPSDLEESPRIKQLGRYRGLRPDGGFEDRWNRYLPAGHALDHLKDMRFCNLHGNRDLRRSGTVGPASFVARRLLDSLPDDAGILILPQAHAGAGMTAGDPGLYRHPENCGPQEQPGASIGRAVMNYPGVQDANSNGAMSWAGGSAPLYLDLLHRLRWVLESDARHRLLGFVWVQGETDAHIGGHHAREHSQHFAAMVDRLGQALQPLRAQFHTGDWGQVPWVNVLATPWWDETIAGHRHVIEGYRRLSRERPAQMYLLDARNGLDGAPLETNRTHYRDPAGTDYPAEVEPPLTDGRSCEHAMMHIHCSSGAYRGELSWRIASQLASALGLAMPPPDMAVAAAS